MEDNTGAVDRQFFDILMGLHERGELSESEIAAITELPIETIRRRAKDKEESSR